MSSCDNDKHFGSWHCPECGKNGILSFLSYVFLAFSVPILYFIGGDTVISRESEDEFLLLGDLMIFIMWWTILIMFFHYREKVKDLKYELLKMKALSYKMTREEIEKASENDYLGNLKYFLENTREQANIKSSNAMEYNIKAINLLLISFDINSVEFDRKYKKFCEFTEPKNT
jgi:hypothetical protein